MSLLHDALKKAEREGETAPPSNVLLEAGESRSFPWRTVALASLAVVCLMGIVYFRLIRKPSSTVPAPKDYSLGSFQTPLQIGGGPAAPELLRQATEWTLAGRFEEARSNLEKVTILEPNNPEAVNNLGLVLKKLGRTQEALGQYQKAISLEPDCAECYNNLGVLYLSDRKMTEAEEQFQKAISLKPDYADPWFHRGLLLEARGDLAGAKTNYLKFVELAQGIDARFLLKVQQRISSLE